MIEAAGYFTSLLFFIPNIRHLPENLIVIKLFVSKIYKSRPPLVGLLAVQISVVSEDVW
jgi:hypothetical protein